MPIGPLPFLDRTAPTFRADVDKFFLTDLPGWSAQLTGVEANVNAKEISANQSAQAAGTAAGLAADSATAADSSRRQAADHAASALAAAQAAQAGAGLPPPTPGALLQGKAGGGVEWANPSPAAFGLENVDNTRDTDKPVSTPQAAALLAKLGGVATKLGHSYVDRGTVAGGGAVELDVNAAAVHRVQAGGALTITLANVPANVSGEIELLAVNFGGKTVVWPIGSWIKPDGSYASAVGNSGVTWQTAGVDRVLIMWDAGSITYKVMR